MIARIAEPIVDAVFNISRKWWDVDDDADDDPNHTAQRNLSPPHHTGETSPGPTRLTNRARRPERRRTGGSGGPATQGANAPKSMAGECSPF
jgi:hypothetical protein